MFMNVIVVVDNHAVAGKSLGVLSDYLVMMTLAQPRSLEGCNALPSVIDMFGKTCPDRDPSRGLTPADAAYLTALCPTDPEAKMAMAQGDISVRMASMLEANGGAH